MNFTVKGVTRVNVPSSEHPVVPYYVLLLDDGNGNFVLVKSFEEHEVGQSFSQAAAQKISRVGVVGTGTMGTAIAASLAACGCAVVIKSRSKQTAVKAITSIEKQLEKTLDAAAFEAARARLLATDSYSDLSNCGVVIESVSEDPVVKKQVFQELGEATPPSVVLGTNTSSLSVSELASVTKHPQRVVGIHFFNPVSKMALVEVIEGRLTSKAAIDAAFALAGTMGKAPILAKDTPGFIVNRLLLPFLNDAVKLLEEGVATREEIDSAVRLGLNHPMGPLELIDLIGIDVFVEILRELETRYGDGHYAPRPLALKLLSEGKLGRKTKEGFYKY